MFFSICVIWTDWTNSKIHEEDLHRKWEYNDWEESEARAAAQEFFPMETGKEFAVTGVCECSTDGMVEYIQWGISRDQNEADI